MSSSLFAMLTPSKTTYYQKLFPFDCLTLYNCVFVSPPPQAVLFHADLKHTKDRL